MIRNVSEINWDYLGDAVPAFLTIIIIPLSYNIAYGVITGIISYAILNGIPSILKRISCGRILPPNYESSERWVVPPGGIIPHWIYRILGLPLPWDDEEFSMEESRHTESVDAISLDRHSEQCGQIEK